MHEFSIAQQVVRVVGEACGKAGATRVIEIKLRIGELSFISEDQLLFSIGELSKGTKLDGARIVVSMEPGHVRCTSCGHDTAVSYESLREASANLGVCAKCGSPAELAGGDGCYVENISVDVPEGD